MTRYLSAGLATLTVLITACSPDASGDPDPGEPAAKDPGYTLLLDDDTNPDQVHGTAGRYALTARGDGEPPLAVVDLPDGYKNFGFFALVDQNMDLYSEEPEDTPFLALNYWTVHGVFANPCTTVGGAPPVGPSVQDLAEVLRSQDMSIVSAPTPVSLGGHDGLFMRLQVPRKVNPDTCARNAYFVWEGRPGDAHHVLNAAGAIERLWILDVHGSRVVLAVITAPGVTEEKVRELEMIVESVQFVTPE
jgi:hypothetical protein